MAASEPLTVARYRMERLAAAFDRVMTSRDWKGPIHAVIALSEREVTEQAILTFTRTSPRFTVVAGDPHRLIVTALGYRLGEEQNQTPDEFAVPALALSAPGPAAGSSAVALPRRWSGPSDPRPTSLASPVLDADGLERGAVVTPATRVIAVTEPEPQLSWSDRPGRPAVLTPDY